MQSGIAHLVQEASVWVQKVNFLKEAMSGRQAQGEATVEEIAEMTNTLKGLYRTMFIDKNDEAERVNVTFSGLADIMDRMEMRLAAIADIPYTRWMSQSPAGMNATGESDAHNYQVMVEAMRKEHLEDPLAILDLSIAKHAGLEKVPDYEWIPMFSLSEDKQATADKSKTEAISLAYKDNAIDEDEYRERLSKMEMFGNLGEWSPPKAEGHPMNIPPTPPGGDPNAKKTGPGNKTKSS